jgi:hypothetical protein
MMRKEVMPKPAEMAVRYFETLQVVPIENIPFRSLLLPSIYSSTTQSKKYSSRIAT